MGKVGFCRSLLLVASPVSSISSEQCALTLAAAVCVCRRLTSLPANGSIARRRATQETNKRSISSSQSPATATDNCQFSP